MPRPCLACIICRLVEHAPTPEDLKDYLNELQLWENLDGECLASITELGEENEDSLIVARIL